MGLRVDQAAGAQEDLAEEHERQEGDERAGPEPKMSFDAHSDRKVTERSEWPVGVERPLFSRHGDPTCTVRSNELQRVTR